MASSPQSPRVKLRVAVAQSAERPAKATDEDVLLSVRHRAETAAARGVELLIFPEMSLTGYSVGAEVIRARAQSRDGPMLSAVASIAREYGVALCVGYAEAGQSDTVYNAVAVFDASGDLAHHYRKTHLYGAEEFGIYTPGGNDDLTVSILQPSGICFGCLICMDCEYPEPARLLALQGAELLIIPTALALGPVQRITPTCVIPSRALENHVHIAYCNFQGDATSPDHVPFCGQSAIVGPDGVTLARAPGPEQHHRGHDAWAAMVDACVEPRAFEADVERNPYLTARRPELYAALAICAGSSGGGGGENEGADDDDRRKRPRRDPTQ
jgi:predicted amidohydrolase